jgi:hypothetical protein
MIRLMRYLLFALFLNTFFLMAQEGAPKTVHTRRGHIISIQRFNLVTKPAPYVQFLLNSDGEEYTIDVGPEWYVHAQGILFIPREEIEVDGFPAEERGKRFLLAKKLRQNGVELNLRDAQGNPMWGVE